MIVVIYGCRLVITLSCGLSNGQLEGNVKVRLNIGTQNETKQLPTTCLAMHNRD
jgi:hypothetical protein